MSTPTCRSAMGAASAMSMLSAMPLASLSGIGRCGAASRRVAPPAGTATLSKVQRSVTDAPLGRHLVDDQVRRRAVPPLAGRRAVVGEARRLRPRTGHRHRRARCACVPAGTARRPASGSARSAPPRSSLRSCCCPARRHARSPGRCRAARRRARPGAGSRRGSTRRRSWPASPSGCCRRPASACGRAPAAAPRWPSPTAASGRR